jgi:FkbM family methyltransferase
VNTVAQNEALKLQSLAKINLENIPTRDEVLKSIILRLQGGAQISYAQNFEDVILNRLFKNQNSGFYADVGAYDPFIKSVSCLFHQKGWSGINIDLCPENIERFNALRPNDINLCSAVGARNEEKTFYMIPGTTRSTVLDSLGEDYMRRGSQVTKSTLRVRPLKEIFHEHRIDHLDFISIDVEGAERDVLEGLDFGKVKPRVFILEATYPETSTPNWHEWENILEAEGYTCAYFDGLNRFYAQSADEDALDALKLPPNYFDNFIRYDYILSALAK